MVGGNTIEPGTELAFALERAELGDDLDEHLLCDLFGVLWMKYHANGDVVDPGLMPQYQLLQRDAVAVLGLCDQLVVGGIGVDNLSERIKHGISPHAWLWRGHSIDQTIYQGTT